MKRIFSFLLAAVMLLAIVPFSVAADTSTDDQGVTYTLSDSTYYTVSGSDKSVTEVVIPSEYNGLPVKKIGFGAFQDCTGLTSVTIPDSVTAISDAAFWNCTGLTNIVIPDSVTTIGEGTFLDCSGLTNVTIGNSVKSIGTWAFSGCTGLTSIVIPDSVTTIYEEVFASCTGLTSVTIGSSVKSIGMNAFASCTGLTDIYCEAETQPSGWDSAWNAECDAIVHWNYKSAVIESVTENAIPGGTEINVEKIDGEDKLSVFEIITEENINKENSELFDIKLIYCGEAIQPNGNVKVSIIAPEGIDVEKAKVYHVSDDGTLTDMNAVYEDGKFVFFTDHFSYYLIAETASSSYEPETATYALGDINMDGTVNQYDYILAKRAHFNTITFNENQKLLGDMDEDGDNDQYDYILIKRIHFKNYSTDKTVEIVVE